MKVGDLIKHLLDDADMDDEVLITKGTDADFDEYTTDWVYLTEYVTNKGCVHLFGDFKGDE